jgi:DNA-binding NtrC family response regulator
VARDRVPTVLIVDDDQEDGRALTRVFEEAGCRARYAHDGQDALATLLDSPADLVITELRMPRMGGLELLRKIRAFSPRIAVVVVTAFGEWGTYVDAMDSGAVDYLTKPVHREAILIVARNALSQRGIRVPSAQSPPGEARVKSEREAA